MFRVLSTPLLITCLILIKPLPVSLYFDICFRDWSTDSRSSALKFHGNAINKTHLVKKKSQLWQSVQKISLHLLNASVLKDVDMLLLNCTLCYNRYTVLIPLLQSFTSFGVITTTIFFD